jgi:hypothetical protein
MMFAIAHYDPETLGVVTRAFDEAWIDIQVMLGAKPLNATVVRSALAKRIMIAVAEGERDPARLKWIALGSI